MASVSTSDVVNLFKEVYGDLQNLLPEDYKLAKAIPYSQKQRVGEKFVEAVILSHETGWTLGGSGMDAFELNPAVAGAVKQAEVTPYTIVLPSVVPWGVISRSAGGGQASFFDATKHIVKNNLRSHGKLQEIFRFYGQSSGLLGYVSYATATYRGVSFTNGGGTLNGITFTAGVNTTTKEILLAPGEFAAGIWVGSEGAVVQQVNSAGTVVAEGNLVSVNTEYGYITVDFTPVAATSTTSHRLCFKGMGDAKEMIGAHKILSTSGTLFGINNSTYGLFKGNVTTLSAVKFTMERFQLGVANAVNHGGLDGDLDVYVNPRTWSNLITTEAGLRRYDSSYGADRADNGMESICFYHQTGKANIYAHPFVKEGHAFGFHLPDWSRSGSAEISFKVPGIDKEVIFPLENQAGYAFRSYSDQYLFCHSPAKSILWTGINDESAS